MRRPCSSFQFFYLTDSFCLFWCILMRSICGLFSEKSLKSPSCYGKDTGLEVVYQCMQKSFYRICCRYVILSLILKFVFLFIMVATDLCSASAWILFFNEDRQSVRAQVSVSSLLLITCTFYHHPCLIFLFRL